MLRRWQRQRGEAATWPIRDRVEEKKKDESSGLITNSERAHDAIDGQMKHKVRAASSSFSSLYPRTCTCACADRPLKLRPLGFFVRSARATTCSTKRVVYRCLVDISNRIFHAFQRFLDSRFHVYHRPLHAAPSFSLALLFSLLSSALRSSTSSCFTFPYIWANFGDKRETGIRRIRK